MVMIVSTVLAHIVMLGKMAAGVIGWLGSLFSPHVAGLAAYGLTTGFETFQSYAQVYGVIFTLLVSLGTYAGSIRHIRMVREELKEHITRNAGTTSGV